MLERGILYMLSGDKHANVLVVSLWSLRKSGYTGQVHLAVGDEKSAVVARNIASDLRLGPFTCERWQPPTGKRGCAYLAKTHMADLSPFDQTLFLDADTMTVGDVSPLFEFGPHGVTLTQFSDWKSNGRKISGRLKSWSDVAPRDWYEVTTSALPAINTGVIAFDRSEGSKLFFEDWRATTEKNVCFICDELAAQLIFWRHAVRVLDDRWNASPIHSERSRSGQAVIYHYHGRKHVNREQGRKLWLPMYDECCAQDIASIRSWTPASDRRLREFLDARDGAGEPDEDESQPEEETAAMERA